MAGNEEGFSFFKFQPPSPTSAPPSRLLETPPPDRVAGIGERQTGDQPPSSLPSPPSASPARSYKEALQTPRVAGIGGRPSGDPKIAGHLAPRLDIREVIRTIAVTGFPRNTRERELTNLLRFLEGYLSSVMTESSGQLEGLGLFSRREEAFMAIGKLEGLLFDTESNSVLHARMAVSQLSASFNVSTVAGALSQSHMPGIVAAARHAGPSEFVVPTQQFESHRELSRTLSVGYFPLAITEAVLMELKSKFKRQAGYVYMDISHGERNVICHVRFDEIDNAVKAQQKLGDVLFHGTRMRIKFVADRDLE